MVIRHRSPLDTPARTASHRNKEKEEEAALEENSAFICRDARLVSGQCIRMQLKRAAKELSSAGGWLENQDAETALNNSGFIASKEAWNLES